MSDRSARMIVLFLLVVVPFFVYPDTLLAQYPNIQVSAPGFTDPEEVTISINPANPLNLAAGANLNYYYYSMDGGLSWDQGILTSSYGVWGDPVVLFDANGNCYYSHLSNPQQGAWIDRIVVQKSIDGGMTWSDGSYAGLNPPKKQDKEWLGVDMTDSPYVGNIYLAWTEFDSLWSNDPLDSTRILCSRSTDQGETWSGTVLVSDVGGMCLDGDLTVEGAVPAVGPGGQVYTSWGGPLGIMFDRSTDGGETFGEDVFVTDQPGGWDFDVPGIYRCNGMPVTVCDVSDSPYRGNIYIAFGDQRNGTDDTDVFFIRSTDGGDTWGDVVRVNNDQAVSHQFFPWMTVDQSTGNIYLVFYDRRDQTGNATDVYMAKSADGGETFTNFKVSESPFTPYSYVFFGDYTNIAAVDGKVYPIWMRMDSGQLSVWTAIIEEPVGVEPGEVPPVVRGFDMAQNYPNPFNPVTTINYDLQEPGSVDLTVYNVKGQLVRTLVSGYQTTGRHTVTWKAEGVSSGVYFYRITVDGHSVVRKCTILK